MSQLLEEDEFYLRVARSLGGCQLVEQALKLYITEGLLLVQKRLGGCMIFKMSGEDYENSSLERLIGVFKKLNDNEALISALNEFKEQRNFISHKAIASCVDPEGRISVSDSEWQEMESELKRVEEAAAMLERDLREEANKFVGHLYFDNLDEDASGRI